MEDLSQSLHDAGFDLLNVPYPSFRKSLSDIVEEVARAIRHTSGTEKTQHFVTHSMGGIVLRCLADRYPELVTGRVIMLAPPNQGSEIIDWLEDCPLARYSLGPAGMNLSTTRVKKEIPTLSSEKDLTVIMGKRQSIPIFNSFLQGPHDGIVTVEGGRLHPLTPLEVVDADHSFIMGDRAVIKRVIQRLKSK